MKRLLPCVVVAASLLFLSCASAPAQQKVPDWALTTPKPDATNTYFVGYSSDAGGDVARASNNAAANLLSGIMQYIGVKVNVDTTATAKASLDSYSANIQATVTQKSSNQIVGFSVKEKYVYTDPKTKAVTVYVLAAYTTVELQKEKARIAALFQEQQDAVAKPEAEGNALLAQGRSYEAVRKFVEAAVAASGSGIDNADIKMERNVNNARTALSRIRFAAPTAVTIKALVGQPFAQPFKVALVSGEGEGAPGIPGAALLVSYQRKQGTRLVSKTETAMTDAQGMLVFSPPPPDFVGKAKFTARIDFQSSLDLLDRLPAKFAPYRDALADEFKGKYVELGYEVSSNARNVSTLVAIADFDENGNAVGNAAQAGLLEALIKERFIVKGATFDPAMLARLDDDAAVAAAKSAGSSYLRVVYGVARLVAVRRDGTTYIADAKASVKAIDIATGQVLYSAEKTASGLGPDEQSARKAALRELGLNAIGKELLSSLP